MLNFGRTEDRNELARLSDAELIAQLADMAKQLGVEINLNYSFAQQISATETDGVPATVSRGLGKAKLRTDIA